MFDYASVERGVYLGEQDGFSGQLAAHIPGSEGDLARGIQLVLLHSGFDVDDSHCDALSHV